MGRPRQAEGVDSPEVAAALEAERLRLDGEFQELYRQRVLAFESSTQGELRAAATKAARSEEAAAEAMVAASMGSQQTGGIARISADILQNLGIQQQSVQLEFDNVDRALQAARRQRQEVLENAAAEATAKMRREVLALEGELLQENVLAEELSQSEEVREAQLNEIQAAATAAAERQAPPNSWGGGSRHGQKRSSPGEPQLRHSGERLRWLEMEAERQRDAALTARSRSDSLAEQVAALEAEVLSAEESQAGSVVDLECESVQALERSEAGLLHRIRTDRSEEATAAKAAEELRARILDLSGDCGALLLGSTAADQRCDVEAARAFAMLQQALPPAHPALAARSLDPLLERLEDEHAEVRGKLLQPTSGTGDPPLMILRADVDELHREVKEAEAEVRETVGRAATAECDAEDARQEITYLDDRQAEVAGLRRDSELLRRQKAEWQGSQVRMLRLLEDLQRQRARGAETQALVATRLGELQRDLPLGAGLRASLRSGSGRKLEEVLGENETMRQKLSILEAEKAELLRKQQGLMAFVRSKMPHLEAGLGGRGCYPPSP